MNDQDFIDPSIDQQDNMDFIEPDQPNNTATSQNSKKVQQKATARGAKNSDKK